MNNIELEVLFLEVLERWYCSELDLNQDWQMDDGIDLDELTDNDYEEYKNSFYKILDVGKKNN